MEYISTIFFLVALLAVFYGLLGVFNPKWLRLTLLGGKSPSRLEALLLAGLLPLPFMFMGAMFDADPGYEGLFRFMTILVFIMGGTGFYLWGLLGIRRYLQHHQNCNPVVAFLVGAVLSLTFIACFLFLLFSVVTYNDPEVIFAEKMLLSGVGIIVFIIFQQVFRIPFLGYMDWSSFSVGEDDLPEPEMPTSAVASHVPPVEPRVFTFMYTEDDGQSGRVEALISAAETDKKGRRYIRGTCIQTSVPRRFWLGRILGPMTGPLTKASVGEQWQASEVFEQLLAFQSAQSDT